MPNPTVELLPLLRQSGAAVERRACGIRTSADSESAAPTSNGSSPSARSAKFSPRTAA